MSGARSEHVAASIRYFPLGHTEHAVTCGGGAPLPPPADLAVEVGTWHVHSLPWSQVMATSPCDDQVASEAKEMPVTEPEPVAVMAIRPFCVQLPPLSRHDTPAGLVR
jgi:hypothetical protein